MSIEQNVKIVSATINPSRVRLIAVTKMQTAATVREAFAAGIRTVGENRVQEAVEKVAQLKDLGLEWHLIGHLQTNKVKTAVTLFSLIHSVDSMHLAAEIDHRARDIDKVQDILIQVNVSKEATKNGVEVSELLALANFVGTLPNLRLCGLMTIAPLAKDPEEVRPVFRETRQLFEKLRAELALGNEFCCLSMGMSLDYPVAVEEGATMIRVGTAIFGARV